MSAADSYANATTMLALTATCEIYTPSLHDALPISQVFLDGTMTATVDTFAPTDQPQAMMYATSSLPAGTHILMINGTRTTSANAYWILVDAFDVTSGGSSAPLPDMTHPSVSIISPA